MHSRHVPYGLNIIQPSNYVHEGVEVSDGIVDGRVEHRTFMQETRVHPGRYIGRYQLIADISVSVYVSADK